MTRTIELLREMEAHWLCGTPIRVGSPLANKARRHLRELEAQAARRRDVEDSICNVPVLGDYVRTESLGVISCVSDSALFAVQQCINRGEDCRYVTETEWLEQQRNLTMCEACGSQTHHTNDCYYYYYFTGPGR
jgi:hypothetical protein